MIAPRVLAISSFVASGTVGLRAIGPALEALSCEVLQIPTVVLSNHPGHAHTAGKPLDPLVLTQMMQALDANQWLAGLHSVLTGYLPSPKHVDMVRDAVLQARSKSPRVTYVLDPILGDDPNGLYVQEEVAIAIRQDLVPRANVTTPNRFELEWLSGMPVTNTEQAIAAARTLLVPATIATSIPAGEGVLATVLITPGDSLSLPMPKLPAVPHGTGDLLSGLLAGYLAHGASLEDALHASHKALNTVINQSCGCDRLDLSALTALAKLP